jgi:hypothetical protein
LAVPVQTIHVCVLITGKCCVKLRLTASVDVDNPLCRYMGFSVRDHKFRYTAWLPWLDTTQEPDWDAQPFRELYDHSADTGQNFDSMDTVNVAYVPSYADITTKMHAQARFFYHTLLPPTGPSQPNNRTGTKIAKAVYIPSNRHIIQSSRFASLVCAAILTHLLTSVNRFATRLAGFSRRIVSLAAP